MTRRTFFQIEVEGVFKIFQHQFKVTHIMFSA